MATFLSNIGRSDELRKIVSDSVRDNASIELKLDRMRHLDILGTDHARTELVVRCKDDDVTVILHLPYGEDTAGQAFIISYREENL